MSSMKKLVFLFLFFLSNTGIVFGTYDYCRQLYTTSTKHFDIIYADNSRDTALYIASFADEYFENINSMLKNTWKERITVVISGDYGEPQGYASPAPLYSTITIFDVPAGIDTTVGYCKDFARIEFFHELTHIISLNIKSDFLGAMSTVFGNWVYPQASMPMFMIEGVTVSTENSDGKEDINHMDGRVNHPWIAEQIKQDIAEGRFKSPQQASGAWDVYPNRQVFYHYGGYFNHYIQKKYGWEKYSELWHKTGENILAAFGSGMQLNQTGVYDDYFVLAFLGNVAGFGLAFKQVYGTSIEEEWKNFGEDIRYKGALDTNQKAVVEGFDNMDTPVLAKGKFYYIDHYNEAIVCYTISNKSSEYLLQEEGFDSINVSMDGKRMLINRYVYKDRKNGLTKAVAQIYDLEKKGYTGENIEGFREVSFYKDSLVGIRAKNHQTDLMKINLDGSSQVLLAGNNNLYFGTPKQLNDKEIVFLVNDNGSMKIGLYNMETKESKVLDAPVKFVRNIGVYDGKIMFSYNNDFTFFKMAVVDGDKLTLQTNNMLGGVFFPMAENGKAYYAESFSKGLQIMEYPEDMPGLTGVKSQAGFVKFAGTTDTNARNGNYKADEKAYNALPYLAPHVWAPFISIKGVDGVDNYTVYSWVSGQSSYYGIDGAGAFTRLQDPMDFNTVDLYAYYNFFFQFANAGIDYNASWLPVHYRLYGFDKMAYYPVYNFLYKNAYYKFEDSYFRNTGAVLDLNYTFNFMSQNQYLRLGLTGTFFRQSIGDQTVSPYLWDIHSDTPSAGAYFKLAEYSMFHLYRTYNYVRGFELNGYINYYLPDWSSDNAYYVTGGSLKIYPYYIPLILMLNGGYSTSWTAFNFYSQNYTEYANLGLSSYYYAGGQAEVELLNFDTQWGLPMVLPIYVNQVSWTAGYRAAYLAESFYQSAFTRLTFTMPYSYEATSQIKVDLYVEGYYAITTQGYGISVGFDLGKQNERN